MHVNRPKCTFLSLRERQKEIERERERLYVLGGGGRKPALQFIK
jgi:hypothetical protein